MIDHIFIVLIFGNITEQYLCIADDFVYGVRCEPSWDYVWNQHMMKDADDLHPDWTLYIIHGFVGQSSILLEYNIKEIIDFFTLISKKEP